MTETPLTGHSEEEDPDDYAFPLTLKSPKKSSPLDSPVPGRVNGVSESR